jgi:long-chain acyl-CoA synthetase
MLGYYKEPAMTKDMFTEDGFLRTGDIGEYDHEGYLIITGRIKDQFKTDKGKYISPAPIEMELMRNTDLDQVCIVGMGIPQPIALVVLSQNAKNKSEIEIAASLSQTVNELNPKLESVAKVQKVVIMKEHWTIDNGLLTPTLKVKRNRVEKIHQDMYKGWYDNEKMVIFE